MRCSSKSSSKTCFLHQQGEFILSFFPSTIAAFGDPRCLFDQGIRIVFETISCVKCVVFIYLAIYFFLRECLLVVFSNRPKFLSQKT